jgi:hypothetical protein
VRDPAGLLKAIEVVPTLLKKGLLGKAEGLLAGAKEVPIGPPGTTEEPTDGPKTVTPELVKGLTAIEQKLGHAGEELGEIESQPFLPTKEEQLLASETVGGQEAARDALRRMQAGPAGVVEEANNPEVKQTGVKPPEYAQLLDPLAYKKRRATC